MIEEIADSTAKQAPELIQKNFKKKYIHVNQHKIKSNIKNSTNDPVITIKQGTVNTYCHEVEIQGPSVVKYGLNGDKILACGARVVIETRAEVKVIR